MIRSTRRSLLVGVAWVGLGACGDPGRDENGVWGDGSAGGGSSSAGTSEVGDASSDPTGNDGGGPGSDGGPGGDDSGSSIKLDVGVDSDDPTAGADGCDKVDLLFVIDSSLSMIDEQDNLIASYPDFIASIQAALPEVGQYHVGVIASSRYANNPQQCREYGSLVTQTEQACGPFAQGNFISDEDDLAQDFACIAAVGSDGSADERPMQSLVAVVNGSWAGPGGCNEAFLREDALLIVVVISDEEDDWEYWDEGDNEKWQGSDGNPPDWYQAVVDAKGGLEQNAVIMTVVGGTPGNQCPDWDGVQGAEDAQRLRQFASMFTNHVVADVCAPSYGPAFEEAISVIDTACDQFVPPG